MLGSHLLLFLAPCLSLAQDYAAPRYNLSLDLPPEQRWEPVLQNYNYTEVKAAMKHILDTLSPKWAHLYIRALSEVELYVLAREPYAGELKGIARTLGVHLGDIVALNLCYESKVSCTSIIAQDDKGNVYHGRNLDYGFTDILKRLTIDVDFVQNGKAVYTGTTFLGFVGLWTGQKPYQFTLSSDARERGIGNWWKNTISAFLLRRSPVSWLMRDALKEDDSFEAAAVRLSETPIIAETYYIMGGTQSNEGMVITRNRKGAADLWPLGPLSGEWFHVETNYDHWTTPPPTDDRRTPAIEAMNATGQENINIDTLYKVLSMEPVLNIRTIYTTVMSAATPENYKTQIRNKV